ncbi:MAG: AAA family ATPase [Clostridia bacterium]
MDRRRDGNQQSTEGYHPLLKAEIEETEQRFLVGRCKEIALIRELISTNHRKEKIVNIYGTGGVGKSYLLDEIRRIAISHSCMYLHIDARDFIHTSEALCKHLYGLLGNDLPMEDDLSTSCLNALNEASQKQKIILAFDTYEEMGDLEHWLREQFFRRLNVNILIVIAGRFPLQGLWRTSPAWRQLILRMPLADLDFESVKEYVSKCSINDERTIYDVWIKTKGHPLTLSLAVSLVEQLQIIEEDDLFSTVVSMWLREVSNKRVRELLEAAAVLRHFNQEILSYVLDRDVSTEDFTALISLSFVRRVKRGWILHDLIRATIANDMRQRMPSRYNELSSRCVLFHYHKIMDDKNANSTVDWERSEWFYYIGNNLVRSFFYQSV